MTENLKLHLPNILLTQKAISMTHFCGLSTVTVFLAEILEQPENTIKERLRQWYLDGGEKKGKKRSQIDVKQS